MRLFVLRHAYVRVTGQIPIEGSRATFWRSHDEEVWLAYRWQTPASSLLGKGIVGLP